MAENEEENQSDYCDDEDEEDDEATLDEEDALNAEGGDDDYDQELRELQEEGEMSLEELQRKYGCGGAADAEQQQPSENVAADDKLLPQPSASSSTSSTSAAPRRIGTLRGKLISAIVSGCESLTHTLSAYFKPEDLEEEDTTEDYMPPEQWKKEIRVGPEYQIDELPPASPKQQRQKGVGSDHFMQALWAPPSTDRFPEQRLINFLMDWEQGKVGKETKNGPANRRKEKTATDIPLESVPDNENALFALYQANYDTIKAIAAPFELANAPMQTQLAGPWREWSDDECDQFEKGMMEHDKHFWKIQRDFLPQRTVSELVAFYYSWKKSERHDLWKAEKCRRDQQVDVNSTDLMGQIADSILQGLGEEGTKKELKQPKGTTEQLPLNNGVGHKE